MGKRLHVAKTYQVEYDIYERFNWQIEPFHDLLDALEIDYSGDEYDDEFDISEYEWINGIKN